MNESFLEPGLRAGSGVGAGLLAAGGAVPLLGGAVHHHVHRAARADRRLTMLYVTNTTLNVQSEMGVIFLVGIAVNNGVLLVEFANKQRKQGMPLAAGDHDRGGHPLPADPDDFPGDVPRSDPDGDRYRARQRGERAAGPGGGRRPVDFDVP